MYDYTGWIVRSEAGREKGELFCVVGVDQEGKMLLLANGKNRRLAGPKRKKLGHVTALTDHLRMYDHPVIQNLKEGRTPSNRDLRRMLAAFQAESRRD